MGPRGQRWFRVKWFKKAEPPAVLPSTPQTYPSGIAVKTDKGTYLIHKDGKRYRIQSDEIFESWAFPRVVLTSEVALKNYPIAYTRLGFRDGTLLHNIKDGKMYLVSESKIRHITSPAVLKRLGATKDDLLLVSDDDINLMKRGDEIS